MYTAIDYDPSYLRISVKVKFTGLKNAMTVWALRYYIIVHNNEVGHLSASFAGDTRTLSCKVTEYGTDHKLNTGVFVFLKYLVLKRELRLHVSTNKRLVSLFMQYLALTLTSPVLFYFSVNLLAKAT